MPGKVIKICQIWWKMPSADVIKSAVTGKLQVHQYPQLWSPFHLVLWHIDVFNKAEIVEHLEINLRQPEIRYLLMAKKVLGKYLWQLKGREVVLMKWQLVWGKSRYMLPLIKVVNDKNVMGVIAPIENLWIPQYWDTFWRYVNKM